MASSSESLNEETHSASMQISDERTIDNAGLNKVQASLLELMEETGYRLVQINGQRRYGGPPPNWKGPPPPKGSEIFVGKIPRNCFEDELVPIFGKVGEIYELRLMMDFSGSNRGYAFVMYSSTEIADLAVQKLNNYEIREGRRIGVVKSVNNCRLFIGGLPSEKSEKDIRCVLCRLTEGVMDVWLFKNTGSGSGGKIRPVNSSVQYAIVEYDSHRSAAMARRRLIPERVELWGREIIVDWATPHFRPKPSEQDFCEQLVRINQEKIPVFPTIPRPNSNSIGPSSDSGIGTLSSRSSSNWSLEHAMDDVLYGNPCTDSGSLYIREHTGNPIQLVKTLPPNVNNLSPPDVHVMNSTLIKNYKGTSLPLTAVDVNGEMVEPRSEVIPRLGNGRNTISDMGNYGVQLGRDSRVYQHCQENCFHDNSFGLEENFDPVIGLQETQIRNYSDRVYRPQNQVYLSGSARTQVLFSDYLRSNEHVQNTQVPVHGRAALTELSYGQALGRFNRLDGGRAIRGSTVGFNTVPTTRNIKAELDHTGNQGFCFQELVQSSKFGENSVSFNGKASRNMCIGGKQALCLQSMGCGPKPANIGDLTSWEGKQNLIVIPEFTSSSNSDAVLFVNSIKTDNSVSYLGGKQEILPASGAGNILSETSRGISMELPFWDSGIFCKSVDDGMDVDMNNHDCDFNRAPGGPVYNSGRYNVINQKEGILDESSPFRNLI